MKEDIRKEKVIEGKFGTEMKTILKGNGELCVIGFLFFIECVDESTQPKEV